MARDVRHGAAEKRPFLPGENLPGRLKAFAIDAAEFKAEFCRVPPLV
jgi:hypothetical protein